MTVVVSLRHVENFLEEKRNFFIAAMRADGTAHSLEDSLGFAGTQTAGKPTQRAKNSSCGQKPTCK
jgi:hypothetical protein